MVLSIGMIVKNEEKNLRKCLENIKPVLEQLESELIIADTGSDDNTVEIAKEFTENVYPIEWENDFAAARNTTLNKAKGDWYMFMDADEYFEDASDLIDFFKSGDHKNYRSATYVLNNLISNEDYYFEASRLFKKEKETKFVDKIHEYIPLQKPQKHLKSVAIHTGYTFAGEEGAEKKRLKHERNLIPLLEMLEKDPKSLRNLTHVINEYVFAGKIDEAKKYIDIGMGLFKKDSADPHYHLFCFRNIVHYLSKSQSEEVIKYSEEYFKNTKVFHTTAIKIRIFQMRALINLERHDKIAKIANEVLKLLDKFERGEYDKDTMVLGTDFGIPPNLKPDFIDEVVRYYKIIGDVENMLLWAKRKDDFDINDVFNNYVKGAFENKKFANITNFYKYLIKSFENGSEDYNSAIMTIEKNIANAEIKQGTASALSEDAEITDDSDYIKLQKLRNEIYTEENNVNEYLNYFINSNKSFSEIYGDVVFIAMKYNVNFTDFLNRLDIKNANSFIWKIILTNYGVEGILIKYFRKENYFYTCGHINIIRIMYIFAYNLLIKNLQNKEQINFNIQIVDKNNDLKSNENTKTTADDTKIALFEAYIMTYHKYLSIVYKEEIFKQEMLYILPENDRAVYYAYKAYEFKNNGKFGEYISSLRKVLTEDDSLKEIVSLIIDKFKHEQEEKENSGSIQSLLQSKLAEQFAAVKNAIIGLMDIKEYQKAAQILANYVELNPSDPEIEGMRKIISDNIKGN